MSFVYILQSLKNGKYYIGSTHNLEQRIHDHSMGYSKSTKILLPVKLVFNQKFANISEARRVENWLKKLKRRDYIEKIVQDKEITKFGPLAQR